MLYVLTESPAEADPTPGSSSAGRSMADTVVLNPRSIPRGIAQSRASVRPTPWSQQTLLTQRHFQPDVSSTPRHLSVSPPDADRLRDDSTLWQKNPILSHLLLTNNASIDPFPFPLQSRTSPRPVAETSVCSATSTTPVPSAAQQNRSDDQILELIEKRLALYIANMKETAQGSSNSEPTSTPSSSSHSPTHHPTSSSSPHPLSYPPTSIRSPHDPTHHPRSSSSPHPPTHHPKPSSSPHDHVHHPSAPRNLKRCVSKDGREKVASDSSRPPELKDNDAAAAKQGTQLSNNTLCQSFVDENADCVELPSSKDSCLAEECPDPKDCYSSTVKSVVKDTSTIRYSLAALKELVGSLASVGTPPKEIFVENVLQTFWNGNMDNLRLFTSTEYDGIMREAAAVCTKKEGESPVVLQAPGSTLRNHHHKPSDQEYRSTWRNVDPSLEEERDLNTQRNIKMVVSGLSSVADSSGRSRSTPTSPELEPSFRGACPDAESAKVNLPQSSADTGDKIRHLNTDYADKSSGTDENVKAEYEQQAFIAETQEKEVQTGESKTIKGLFERMYEGLRQSKYDDITDDEGTNDTPQISTLNATSQNRDSPVDHLLVQPVGRLAKAAPAENVDLRLSVQIQDISDDERPGKTGNGSRQVQTPRRHEQNSTTKGTRCANVEREPAVTPPLKQLQEYTRAYFVENEGGVFEEGLWPKCVQDRSSQRQEGGFEDCEDAGCDNAMDPEDEEDEVFEIVAWNVIFEDDTDDVVVIEDEDEEFDPSSLDQPKQPTPSDFQRIPMYTYTLEDFLQLNGKQFNVTGPALPTVPSEPLPVSNNLPEPEAVDDAPPELASASCAEAEDSCDTDDSSDYPLHPKRNFLAVPNEIRAPSSSESDSAEEGDAPQPQTSYRLDPAPEQTSSSNKRSPPHSKHTDLSSPTILIISSGSAEEEPEPQPRPSYRPGPSLEPTSSNLQFFPDLSSDESEVSTNNSVNCSTSAAPATERLGKGTAPVQDGIKSHRTKTLRKRKARVIDSDSDDDDQEQDRNQAAKRKCPTTASMSEHRNERRKPKNPSSVPTKSTVQKVQKKDASGLKSSAASGVPNRNAHGQNTNANVSKMTKQTDKRLPSHPLPSKSLSSQSNASFPKKASEFKGSSMPGTLRLNGQKYQASSLPGNKTQPKPQQRSSSLKPDQLNSYSTEKSTPAKQRLVANWESGHVQKRIERRRRSSLDPSARPTATRTTNGRDHEKREVQRQRHNSHETPLLKRTKVEAKQLTQHAHRQPATDRSVLL